MSWGLLKKAGKVALSAGTVYADLPAPGARLVRAALAAANAIEMVSDAKGEAKTQEALAAVPAILGNIEADRALAAVPLVQDAIRDVMKAYVAVQNTQDALEAAVGSLNRVVEHVKATTR